MTKTQPLLCPICKVNGIKKNRKFCSISCANIDRSRNPEFRIKASTKQKQVQNSPEVKNKLIIARKDYWNNLSDGEYKRRCDQKSNYWESLSEDDRNNLIESMRRGLSTEKVSNIISIKKKAYWDNLPDNIANEIINKSTTHVGKKYQTGNFHSIKSNKDLWFRSSYELAAFIKLENDDSVKTFDVCNFHIKYSFQGRIRRYFPDILIEYVDETKEIVEIKPKCRLDESIIVAKKQALDEYCFKNNIKSSFWTEDNLPINKKEVQEDERKPNINLVKNGLSSIEILAA